MIESLYTKSWLTEEEQEQIIHHEMQEELQDRKRQNVKEVDIAWLRGFLEMWEHNSRDAPKEQY